MEDVYLPGTFEGKGCHVAVAASGSDRDWGRSFVFVVLAAVQTGVIIPALITAAYAFLTIRFVGYQYPGFYQLCLRLFFQAAIF